MRLGPILSLLLMLPAMAATSAPAAPDQPGTHIVVRVEDLPPPHQTDSVGNQSETVDRPADAHLDVPPGFKATLFADDLPGARYMAVAPNGDVFLARSRAGLVVVLRDAKGGGTATERFTFAEGLSKPHGIAFHDGYVYIADTRAVWRVPYRDGDTKASARLEQVTPPDALGDAGGHWTRNVLFAQGRLLVTIGSRSNVGEDAPPRATIRSFAPDGSDGKPFATGLRNAIGIALYPGTEDVYTVVNERDGLGDRLVPDYFTKVRPGAFYGWPYAYLGQHPDPDYGGKAPQKVAEAVLPDLLFESHSAPIDLIFYTGTQFPAAYRGDAFVTLHGSWNRADPTGYKVVRVPMKNGKPAGGYDNFATGFRIGTDSPARVWGRPAGIAQAKDGSLLVADDAGGAVWRIAYTGAAP